MQGKKSGLADIAKQLLQKKPGKAAPKPTSGTPRVSAPGTATGGAGGAGNRKLYHPDVYDHIGKELSRHLAKLVGE